MSEAHERREEGEAAEQAASPAPEGPTVDLDEDAAGVGDAAVGAAEPEEAALPGDERSPEELRAALAETEGHLDEYVDLLRRERAEFENFRKRATREREEAMARGAEQLMERLLPVLDNFGMALDAASKSEDEGLAKGVQMVHGELVSALTQAGLEAVPGEGATFDPEVHEAMMSEQASEPLSEPVVTEVLRAGYRFKGRVLRPASVKVARSEPTE